jgi:GntR family transcriptional regulator/MocR family aminotransferase
MREDEVATRAAERSLALGTIGPFRHERRPADPRGLVVGYAASPEHAYGQALAALGDVLAGT